MTYPHFNEKDIFGINGVGEGQLLHSHFERWHEWIITEYKPPNNKIGVFLPCAAIKPYYNSPIHKEINKVVEHYPVHKIVVSNAGIIPYEFANEYPFNSYDWNPAFETEEIKKKYIQVTKKRIWNYLFKQKNSYIGFVAYFRPNAESLIALKEVFLENGVKLNIVDVEDIGLSPTADWDLLLAHSTNLKKLVVELEDLI